MKRVKDVYYYLQGNVRYYLYYSKLNFLLRSHIKEQINYRIKSMDPKCYDDGTCVLCGCKTTALQMCNKSCDKPCYPYILSSKKWKHFMKRRGYIVTNDKGIIKKLKSRKDSGLIWFLVNDKFKNDKV